MTTTFYTQSEIYGNVPTASDLFDDYADRFPRIDATGWINYWLDDAAALDACVYEVRRRVAGPVRFQDAALVAEKLLAQREMFEFDYSEPVTRFTL